MPSRGFKVGRDIKRSVPRIDELNVSFGEPTRNGWYRVFTWFRDFELKEGSQKERVPELGKGQGLEIEG